VIIAWSKLFPSLLFKEFDFRPFRQLMHKYYTTKSDKYKVGKLDLMRKCLGWNAERGMHRGTSLGV